MAWIRCNAVVFPPIMYHVTKWNRHSIPSLAVFDASMRSAAAGNFAIVMTMMRRVILLVYPHQQRKHILCAVIHPRLNQFCPGLLGMAAASVFILGQPPLLDYLPSQCTRTVFAMAFLPVPVCAGWSEELCHTFLHKKRTTSEKPLISAAPLDDVEVDVECSLPVVACPPRPRPSAYPELVDPTLVMLVTNQPNLESRPVDLKFLLGCLHWPQPSRVKEWEQGRGPRDLHSGPMPRHSPCLHWALHHPCHHSAALPMTSIFHHSQVAFQTHLEPGATTRPTFIYTGTVTCPVAAPVSTAVTRPGTVITKPHQTFMSFTCHGTAHGHALALATMRGVIPDLSAHLLAAL